MYRSFVHCPLLIVFIIYLQQDGLADTCFTFCVAVQHDSTASSFLFLGITPPLHPRGATFPKPPQRAAVIW